MKKRVAVLGATGSIGKSALDVIAHGKDDFELVLLSAHNRSEELAELGRLYPGAVTVHSGAEGGRESLLAAIAACGADITLNGISGAAGLEPSMAAIEAGSNLALANKETLVMAGQLVLRRALKKKVKIIPVDSEHSAIFHLIQAHCAKQCAALCAKQCAALCAKQCAAHDALDEIILTASGGPFRNYSLAEMEKVSPRAALAHPIWKMGAKITVDSASMANKGLEVIEAARLFNCSTDKIKVVIHPQSVVHSMIRMKDGEVYAQLSRPDMRLPIRKALYWPGAATSREVGSSGLGRLDFDSLSLDFYPPDTEKFPMLALAYEAVKMGGLYPCAYNAANEAAVTGFLAGRFGFLDIIRITRYILEKDWNSEPGDIASVLEADRQARTIAEKEVKC